MTQEVIASLFVPIVMLFTLAFLASKVKRVVELITAWASEIYQEFKSG